jgi:hypothetical protein
LFRHRLPDFERAERRALEQRAHAHVAIGDHADDALGASRIL